MSEKRLLIIDGSLEADDEAHEKIQRILLVPVFKEIITTVLTLEGLEEVVQKVLTGYKEGE